MQAPKKKQTWTAKQTEILKEYILKHAQHLKFKFYENIIAGSMKFRKFKGFFIDLGRQLGKSSVKCKSKFQKMESTIYLDLLELPESHFELYLYIRKGFKLVSDNFDFNGNDCSDIFEKPDFLTNNISEKVKISSEALRLSENDQIKRHTYFENLRIQIILDFKFGKIKTVKFGN